MNRLSSHRGPSAGRPPVPLWTRQDTVMLCRLPVAFAMASLVPESRWGTLTRFIARRRLRRRPRRAADQRAWLARYLGPETTAEDLDRLLEQQVANFRLQNLYTLRCLVPGGWRPALRLDGREWLERALAEGKGAILWVAPFVFSSLVTKMNLHHTGFPVAHLSRYNHGYSDSRLGSRLLNPIRRRAENEFIAERVTIGMGDSPKIALQRLTAWLASNRPISIVVGARASETRVLPFFGGRMAVATGPAKLARRTGAPLLPVFTVRDADGTFVTAVEAPLRAEPDHPAGDPVGAMLADYAPRLEQHVRRSPEQFLWFCDILSEVPAAEPQCSWP